MTAALLHRRLTAAMALSALAAYAAGAGWTADVLAAALALGIAIVRLPPASWSPWIERGTRLVIVALCAWMMYVAFVLAADFMPAIMAMLLVLLGAESLRSLSAPNDARLYLLSFALLIAATAFYPGLVFAAGFVAFIVFSTLAMMVGFLRRQSERFGAPDMRVGRGMIAATAALSAVTLVVAVGLFVLFPRLPRQWNVQGRPGGGDVMTGFSDQVELGQHGGRLVPNPQVAFRVEFPDGAPARPGATHWRGRSFDRFDGLRWSRTRGLPGQPIGPGTYGRRWGGPLRRTRIFGGPPGAAVLFGPHPVLAIQPRSAIRVFQESGGDVLFAGSDAPVYTVTSAAETPPEDVLRRMGRGDSRLLAPFLQLPRLSPAVRRLADSLMAGKTDRIDQARAVERYLSTEFGYTLNLPETRADATVEGFLFRRREGHCEYFSTAMVMLLRAGGIPARNVTGFLGGEWNAFGGYLAVTGNDAHSWVEVWFPEAGWVPMDPTPASRGEVVSVTTGAGWTWPARFWFDGMEHRWYKWVIDYNLEKQIGLLRSVGDLFDRQGGGERAGRPGGGRPSAPPLVAVIVAAALAFAMFRWMRRTRPAPRSAETRAYVALRRVYARAGLGGTAGPMDFADQLLRENAPGAGPAAELVALYVRSRFGAADVGEAGRERMSAALREARAALSAARRKKPERETAGV